MSILLHRFGKTTIAKVSSGDELRRILVDPWLKSETIVIKPNWVSAEQADFIDSDTLRTVFEALDSQIVVTESYSIARSLNLLKEGMSFSVKNKKVNWKWLLKGDGWNWLIDNSEWSWFKKDGHWDQIKKEDQTFLNEHGFTDFFKEFKVSYINVTDEVWNGRIVDPTHVKRLVESRFEPLKTEKLYNMVPKKLYELRGSTFISLAKLKMYASFTMKNLFGMIPDPLRSWWHGPKNSRIATSIVDINKLYHSLFNVYGICEALYTTGVPHPDGKFEGTYSGKYNVIEGLGIVAFGRDLVALDAILLNLVAQTRLVSDETNRTPIDLAEKEFGVYDRTILDQSKRKVGNWFSSHVKNSRGCTG